MTFNKFYILFLIIFLAGLGVYFILRGGYYPIAITNGTIITARSLNEIYASASRYYEALLKNTGQDLGDNREDFQKELQLQIFNQLIERIIIYQGVKNAVGDDLLELVSAKLPVSKLQEPNFQEAIKAMYGMDVDDFKEIILVPQAYREILAGRLNSEEKEFDRWLSEAKRSASVTLLFSGFSWQNGELIARD